MKTIIPADIFDKFSITVPISQALLYDKDSVLLYFCNMENDNFDKEIGAYIKKARLSMGMTQDQLAEYFDCTKSNISGWEKGRHIPPYKILCALAKKSGLPLPHDKANEVLEQFGINVNTLDIGSAELVKTALNVPRESADQAKKILVTFNKDGKEAKGEQ